MDIPVRGTKRDLNVSLVILVCGIALDAVFFGLSTTSAFLNDPAFGIFVVLSPVVAGAGGICIFAGAVLVAINWSILRRRRRDLGT